MSFVDVSAQFNSLHCNKCCKPLIVLKIFLPAVNKSFNGLYKNQSSVCSILDEKQLFSFSVIKWYSLFVYPEAHLNRHNRILVTTMSELN